MATPVFRFAPSPNGRLHLGHAASALLNAHLADKHKGRFLLRIEDIDITRCRPEFIDGIEEDLTWLGLDWERPVMRQSERFHCYEAALDSLENRNLLYRCFCTRKDIGKDSIGLGHDPDGAPLYSGRCWHLTDREQQERTRAGEPFALRLRMTKALATLTSRLTWSEGAPDGSPVIIRAEPELWGDVVLKRKEFPASYHLAVTVDDAEQGVTHVVRGQDLFAATAIHRLLQVLLDLPEPRYFHHDLIRDDEGSKLSKSLGSRSLADLRRDGISAEAARQRSSLHV